MKKIYLALIVFFCIAGIATASYTTKVYFDQSGNRMVVADGGTILVEDGATVTLDDGVLAVGDVTVAEGSVIVGNASAVGSVLDASGDTKILIGNGTTITSAALSGDVTMANTGAVTIAANAVELSMMSNLAEFAQVRTLRTRVSIADINGGVDLLPLITGSQYQLVNARAIAIGGAVGTVTTVDILATQSAGSVKLVAFAQASLTQSTVLTAGGTGAAVLADGASFIANDVSTAITVSKTGGAADTATHVDIILEYVIYTAP